MTLQAILGSMLIVATALAQPPRQPPVDTLPIDNLKQRLEALQPGDPMPYYLLAEEVAQEFQSPDELELARTLLVLAFHLDRDQGGTLAPSCAIALAQLQGIGQDRDWLIALAHALDHRYATPDWRGGAPDQTSDHDAYLAAVAVGRVRSGHGRDALALLEDPRVMAIIKRYEPLLSPANQPGAADWLLREARRWPCPECGFDRINRAIDASQGPYVKCRVCAGNPGPEISQDELIAQLRFEARMLNGVQRSWAAQVIADAGAPLRDPLPEELAPTLGIDPRLSLWRDGSWIAPPRDDAEMPDSPSERVPDDTLDARDTGTSLSSA